MTCIAVKNIYKMGDTVQELSIKVITHVGQFPQDGENGQNVALFIFVEALL